MIREEAIIALGDRNNLLWGMSTEEKKYYSEALDMAISALSAEPKEWNYKNIEDWANEHNIVIVSDEWYQKAYSALSAEGEYIKKEDALNKVEELKKIHFDRVVVLNKVSDGLNGLPTYSFPDREKGEWISREGTGECFPFWERHKCSKCGKYGEGTFNFCPNCGADMRGGDK